ncbi:MAG: DUF4301 family protein [Ekhidna sp.]|nr:DUF4301 family protein [Ekhidna sp.]
MLKESDYALLEQKEISEKHLQHQLERFERGFEALQITSPATIDNGILRLSDEAVQNAVNLYEESEIEVLKFVPASGAASRMFKNLFAVLDSNGKEQQKIAALFFENMQRFAFTDDLQKSFESEKGRSFKKAVNDKDIEVIASLLTEKGLNYGGLPKGLLRFHRYEGHVRTPAQEHLEEGVKYAQKEGVVKIHFTVSPAHLEKFQAHVEEAKANYAGVNIRVDFSFQKESTDTVAVDMENVLFRDESGKLLFRPAGHGALLENLNQLNTDIIFIKNIDNVVPDRLKQTTIRYKMALAGILLKYQSKAFGLLEKAESGEDIVSEGRQLLLKMGSKGDFPKEEVLSYLNRPIRVCGMVKNEGEAGGGPFWVRSGENESLQIVEAAQVDKTDALQQSIFKRSTHFNPVDLVCGVRNYKGEKFDLLKYRDENTGFITEKSYQGKKLKAMELPGLWNGSMADWNTVFVEVPLLTFNPVKTVMDLLKSNHC